MASPPPELLEDCPPPAISREVLPAIAADRADDAGRAYVRRMETLHDPS